MLERLQGLERLQDLEGEYEAVEAQLADPAVLAEPNRLRDASRRHKQLTPLVTAYRRYVARQADLDAAHELLGEATGEERELLRAEAHGAEQELERFAEKWDHRYPMISAGWIEHWERIVPFLAFPPDVRRVVYTTNTIEALNRQIRKIIKTRGSFPNDDAALKLLYLAIKNAGLRWRRGVEWTAAMGQFAIQFGSRFPGSAR